MKRVAILMMFLLGSAYAVAEAPRARLLGSSCERAKEHEVEGGAKPKARVDLMRKMKRLFFAGTYNGYAAEISYDCRGSDFKVVGIQVAVSFSDSSAADKFYASEVSSAEKQGYRRCLDTANVPEVEDMLKEGAIRRQSTLRLKADSDYTISLWPKDSSGKADVVVSIGAISSGLIPGQRPVACLL